MRDPYLYDDVAVLRNKLGIKSQALLDEAEADYVAYNAFFSDGNDFSKKEYLQKIVYDAFELYKI